MDDFQLASRTTVGHHLLYLWEVIDGCLVGESEVLILKYLFLFVYPGNVGVFIKINCSQIITVFINSNCNIPMWI